ncbi:MAG: 2-oxoacid:acceptor oxidoreductase family protein [Candidatus Thermoplasmatota archaeon]|nr:2-oxoacid:acceptor oxidoreductase family protein [Candidatus Thermoplasmatota archaeon]
MTEPFTFIVGGKAGMGVRSAGSTAASIFNDMGRHVFQMDDYPSLIRGGHNFSVVSTATGEISSHYLEAQLVVALDQRSYKVHRGHVADDGVMVHDTNVDGDGVPLPVMEEAEQYDRPDLISGVASIAVLCAAVGMTLTQLEEVIRRAYPSHVEDNLAYATALYEAADDEIGGRFTLSEGDRHGAALLTGNQAIALGAASAGLNNYFAYPMTPSTSILHFLAGYDRDLGVAVMQPENEIAAANMAVGAAFAGSRVMVATSGGGFALMEEAFSMAGMAEAPVLFVLSMRPGPSTGVPTYTGQGDLGMALHQGHGEFPRLVASPGGIEEAFSLAGELLGLVWRFQTPGVLLTEKHCSESAMNVVLEPEAVPWAEAELHQDGDFGRYRLTDSGVSKLLFPPSRETVKWNSYECDENGITTEDADTVEAMHDKRQRKHRSMLEHLRDMHTVNVYGDTGPAIFTYGSTTLSVLEALRAGDIDARVVQPVYLRPFPVWELDGYRDVVVVEQSAAGSFEQLLREKTDIAVAESVRKYDGRPFEPTELARELGEVLV